jgi:phytoene synthase
MNDLLHYCHLVASTVGLICIDIWGYGDERAPQLAIDCGVAYQLTNILRDYREDYESGRVYLPNDVFQRHGLSAEDVYCWQRPAACKALVLELLDRAEVYYDRCRSLESMISADCRPTLRVMTGIYHGLLERISENPSSIARGPRIRLSSLEKLTIVGGALWKQRGAGRAAASAAP